MTHFLTNCGTLILFDKFFEQQDEFETYFAFYLNQHLLVKCNLYEKVRL